jgi:hypothetical protein
MNRTQRMFQKMGLYKDHRFLPREPFHESVTVETEGSPIPGVTMSHGQVKASGTALHYPERVLFGMMKRIPMIVTAPHLELRDALAWIGARQEMFRKYEGSRESLDEAIRRRAIAAQGVDFVKALLQVADEDIKGEITMMFSDTSHHGIEDDVKAVARRPGVLTLAVDKQGVVSGLPDRMMTDNSGFIFIQAENI